MRFCGCGTLGVLLLAGMAVQAHGAESAPWMVINEDNSHFYGSRSPEEMTIEGLNAWVDQYAATKVTHLFLNSNAMRASFDSKTFDAIWELGDQAVPPEGFAKKWFENARILHERGLDPYQAWIARCREKGLSPWLTMRMNDVHDVSDTTNFMHSTFWLKHPDYWRVPESTGAWTDRALDYGIPEVREHHMAFIRELLERYDPDGLELDWMRFGYHFKPGQEQQGGETLTEFMRQVRALTREWEANRGHPIKLGARVPAHPDAAVGLGMDGVRWAREGLVDLLVPTPFWASTDFDVPIELWRERIGYGAAGIRLMAGAEVLVRAWPGGEALCHDLLSVRGFAAAEWHRGSDGIYLFNFMDPAPIQGGVAAYRDLLEQGLAYDVVQRLPRRHPVTYRDTVPSGMSNGAVLPIDGPEGGEFRIYAGPKPEGGSVIFLAGLADREGVADSRFDAKLNGQACEETQDYAGDTEYPGVKRAVQFACPLEALQQGYNTVTLKQREGGSPQQAVWAELRIEPALR